jgi:hypothetical protein
MRIRDCLKLPSCFHWGNGERQLGRLNADLHVGKVEQCEEQATLIALPGLQFVGNIHHLPKQPIKSGNLPGKERLILRYTDLRKAVNQVI